MRWLACVVTMLFMSLSHAQLPPDLTGLWFDPAESGWGLTLAQQGRTTFAVLFVYDSTGKPAWFAADNMQPSTFLGLQPAGTPTALGTLYRTSGPWFGGAFDPHAVSVAPVGSIDVLVAGNDGSQLSVNYTIDGVHVSKTVSRQTWGDNSAGLVGRFSGGVVLTTAPTAACPGINFSPASGVPFGIGIASGPLADELRFTWGTGIDTLCQIDGTYAQQGQLASVVGTLGCAPIGFTLPRDITAHVTQLMGNANGFSGAVSLQQGSCNYTGHIGGVRLP